MSYALKLIAYVLITLFLGVVLRELGFKGAKLVLIVGMISVIGAITVYIGKLASEFAVFGEGTGAYATAILKIVGVGYAFGICSDICAELGEGGLASAVCLFGRVEIMAILLPFIKMIIEKGIGMI